MELYRAIKHDIVGDGMCSAARNVIILVNIVRGTTGEEFPPLVGDRVDEDLWVFTNDICRSIFFRYSGRDY